MTEEQFQAMLELMKQIAKCYAWKGYELDNYKIAVNEARKLIVKEKE